VRFRPIVLTSVTTFVGLAPLIMDKTISLVMFVPMATSLAFGVLMGTLITLFLVPCLYMVLEDLMRFRQGGHSQRRGKAASTPGTA
jgi:multidrug efflux pump subunit AcrB